MSALMSTLSSRGAGVCMQTSGRVMTKRLAYVGHLGCFTHEMRCGSYLPVEPREHDTEPLSKRHVMRIQGDVAAAAKWLLERVCQPRGGAGARAAGQR
jgi:hypothetical protein